MTVGVDWTLREASPDADGDAVAASGLDRQHHRLGGRRRAVVQRGVGDVQAGERADHRLELEDGLEGAL
jgi:hypothetical protein